MLKISWESVDKEQYEAIVIRDYKLAEIRYAGDTVF
jgi:hypothetical protein